MVQIWIKCYSLKINLEKLWKIGNSNPTNYLKDTHREKASSNKTPALTKSTNMDIGVVGTSNQLFIRGP